MGVTRRVDCRHSDAGPDLLARKTISGNDERGVTSVVRDHIDCDDEIGTTIEHQLNENNDETDNWGEGSNENHVAKRTFTNEDTRPAVIEDYDECPELIPDTDDESEAEHEERDIASVQSINKIVSGSEHLRQPGGDPSQPSGGHGSDKKISEEPRHPHLTRPSNDPLPNHLEDLYKRASAGKQEHEKQIIKNLLAYHQVVFSVDDNDLGLTQLAEHRIDTGNATPVKQPPRRVPIALAHEEKAAIDQLKKKGVIQESNSPWASAIVLVKKKNGQVRPCVDYRILNKATLKDAYPLPRTQDCLDALSGAAYFTTLDMTSGYHQVPIRKEDIHKTAFVTRHGFYEFKTMPFGLTNAPATFQRLMELALLGLQWTDCLIYLDDVIIFGTTFEEHAMRVSNVLERIEKANLKLKVEKCDLFQEEVEFLGHMVSKEGVKPSPNNIAKVIQWKEPETVTEVRQFLGLCSYYRRFVKGFSSIARPLTELTKKDVELVWNTSCQEAFDKLKGHLTGAEVMSYPTESGEYILDTDASDFGIGAVLSQVQEGRERVVSYASRAISKSEKNYCVTDKELLAVKYFIEYFRYYLLGRRFTLRTDHQAIRWLFTMKEPKGRLARWLETLATYEFEIEYRPGPKHLNADGMSRCINPRDCTCPDMDNMEELRCGPCSKCKKRAAEMCPLDSAPEDSPVNVAEETARAVYEPVSSQQTEGPCDNTSMERHRNIYCRAWSIAWRLATLVFTSFIFFWFFFESQP